MSDDLPLVQSVPWPDWSEMLRLFAQFSHVLYLDSASADQGDARLAEYSFLMADPVAFFQLPAWASADQARDIFNLLAETYRRLRQPSKPHLPPFQGGLAGYFGYELNRAFEDVPPAAWDDCGWPLLAVGLYDVVLAADHRRKQAWLISQGLCEGPRSSRRARARERLAMFREMIQAKRIPERRGHHCPDLASISRLTQSSACLRAGSDHSRSAPQVPPEGDGHSQQATRSPALIGQHTIQEFLNYRLPLTSNFTPQAYVEAVRRAVEYIRAGDVFQVNLAQRLAVPALGNPLALYDRLRTVNPAPYAGFFDFGAGFLMSASPECFLRVRGGHVETRPIKGTRPRSGNQEIDRRVAAELQQARKDRAENIMITDLLRNDLSRVCEPSSVRVKALCQLEDYPSVFHLVSVIEGQLAEGKDVFDLLAASFPGGSISGAPKIRAMEIIAELEPHVRGPYCGCLGYIGLDGNAELNILIRTVLQRQDWWLFSVGGGLVVRSDPVAEYEETWHKARAIVRAIAECQQALAR